MRSDCSIAMPIGHKMQLTKLILVTYSLVSPSASHSQDVKDRKSPVEKSGFELVHVEGGTFTMGGKDNVDDGGPAGGANADECPHEVTVESFYIAKYEVTQADWISVMESNPSKFGGNPSYPVEQVSWNDIQVFLERLNLKTGKNYRLPTEQEWEFAAKGGNAEEDFRYSGSDDANQVAWYSGNSDKRPHPVGSLSPNSLGLYDMSGNIWEWCSDFKIPYPCDPEGKVFDSRVLRGGSWSHRSSSVRVRDRNARHPDQRLPTLGFRLARSAE